MFTLSVYKLAEIRRARASLADNPGPVIRVTRVFLEIVEFFKVKMGKELWK